jgi:hypothetical protein
MIHPLEEDLSKLKDSDLESRILDLNKKYHVAYRLGKPELLTQIEIFVNIYRQEMQRRYLEKSKNDLDNDLGQLINVD